MAHLIDSQYKKYAEHRIAGKHNFISSFFLVYPFLRNKRVLDIGCSDGLYLKLFGPESIGIEQIPELVSKAKSFGLNVLHGNIISLLPKIDSESLPAVFFSHVMEHLDSPISSLREINRILTRGGSLVLGLPTENNLFRSLFRKDYFDGTHLYSFSVKNTIKLLKDTGFIPVKVFYDLPKCRGSLGRAVIKLYQHFPFKEKISMAYWVVAKKK